MNVGVPAKVVNREKIPEVEFLDAILGDSGQVPQTFPTPFMSPVGS